MSLQDGGHLTHGHPKIVVYAYNVVNYGVNPGAGYIDYDESNDWPKRKNLN